MPKPYSIRPRTAGAHLGCKRLGANGIHALDALIFMMGGLPQQVTAIADGTQSFSALMRWPNGAQGVFRCNNRAGARREEWAFSRRPAKLRRVLDTGLVIEKDGVTSTVPAGDDGVAREHDAFLRAVRGRREAEHSSRGLRQVCFWRSSSRKDPAEP